MNLAVNIRNAFKVVEKTFNLPKVQMLRNRQKEYSTNINGRNKIQTPSVFLLHDNQKTIIM